MELRPRYEEVRQYNRLMIGGRLNHDESDLVGLR